MLSHFLCYYIEFIFLLYFLLYITAYYFADSLKKKEKFFFLCMQWLAQISID